MTKPKKTYLPILLLMVISTTSLSQEVNQEISNIMQAARNGESLIFSKNLINESNSGTILNALEDYYTDTMLMVRSKAYSITKMIGVESMDKKIREKVVNSLCDALKDESSGIIGMASRYLSSFNSSDFNQEAQQKLVDLLDEQPPHYKRIIKLVGFLGVPAYEPQLREVLDNDSTLKASERWAVHLALARLGNQQSLNYCVNKVGSLVVNDDVVYELLPDLVYIRQPQAINYLVEVLNSDEKKCSSPDPDSDMKFVCGYRVMEFLAPVIKDFPLKTKASGDIDGYPYPEALKIARQWFEENKTYELVTERY